MSGVLEIPAPSEGERSAARSRSPPGAWRLLLPALIGWGIAAWAVTVPGVGAWVAGVGALGGFGAGAWALTRRGGRGRAGGRSLAGSALLLCAILLLLGTRIALGDHARADPLLADAADRGGSAEFAAVLTGFPETRVADFGERHWVRADALVPRGAVPVLLWLNERPGAEWAPGLRIEVRGAPDRFEAGGSAAYGISVRQLRASGAQPWTAHVGGLAAGLRVGLREAASAVPGARLVPGFAVGDTALVSETLDRAMRDSSLSHLTAVSGANCALVTGAAIWMLARLGAGRRSRALVAAAALAAFVAVVGPDASVQRAAVMATVLLVSGFGGKRAVSLPALGLAILVLLGIDPWQSLHPGFALSVAATAGILLGATPVSRWLHRRLRLPRMLALPIAVALAAQFACGPLLLFLQPGIPAVGVLANVIAAPAAPLGTGIGLAAALLAPLSAEAAQLAVRVAGLPARWVEATAEVTAGLPLARWHWPEGWPGALLLAGCQLLLIAAWALRKGYLALPGTGRIPVRRPWYPPPMPPRGVRLAVSALLGTAVGVFSATAVATPIAARLDAPAGWAVVACDVGQGDGLLLRDPASPDRVMLVDTGEEPEPLIACLDRFGVDRIALLVLSHDDRDHVGALPAILGRIDAALIAPAARGERNEARAVVQRLERSGVPFRIGAAGDAATSAAAPRWEVLAPEAGAVPIDTNAASLVMRVTVGNATVLLLGDIGGDEQRALLRGGLELRADIVKVAHHGSRDQDPALPEAVGAQWALVSAGAGNGYGHPARETLAMFAAQGTRVLRTDLHGSAALVPRPDGELEPWVERAGAGGAP